MGTLETALSFAARGWPVFPVNSEKLPAVKSWESSATTDPDKIKEWYEVTYLGGCNFGFAAGRADILVIDSDRNKVIRHKDAPDEIADGEKSLSVYLSESGHALPRTYTVRTPSGGIHRYFKAKGLRGAIGYLPAVDVKTCGGYVVIPGSVTCKGEYVVIDSAPVAELPGWFADAYGRKKKEKSKPSLNYNLHIMPDTEDKIDAAISLFDRLDYVDEGVRNQTLYQVMRDICKAGVSKGKAEELYLEYGLEKIGLDLDEREVHATIDSAYKDMSDLGLDSEEGRKLRQHESIKKLDELPDISPDSKNKTAYSDNGGFDVTDALVVEPPRRKWFVDGWLSADPGFTCLFSGKGGTGKSSLVLDLQASLASGEAWCGLKVQRASRSLYVSCEDSEEELKRRLWARKLALDGVPAGVMRLWSRLGADNIICSADKSGVVRRMPFAHELIKRAKAHFRGEGGVLILDTLSDIFNGNENDRCQVSQFVKHHLNQIALDIGCTLIVLAHPAKGEGSAGYSGSTAWEGAFRCRWELNYKDSKRVDGLLELVHAKGNYRKAGSKITLENRAGICVVVDSSKADNWIRDEIVRLIDEAYGEGSPFGRDARAERPIQFVKIKDSISDEYIGESEIKKHVSELISDRKIEVFKTEKRNVLRKTESASDGDRLETLEPASNDHH